jgi:hypothetical protein
MTSGSVTNINKAGKQFNHSKQGIKGNFLNILFYLIYSKPVI